jgi:hypothetical protein
VQEIAAFRQGLVNASSRATRSRHLPHDALQPLTNARAKPIERQLLEHAPNEFVVGTQ